MPTFTRTSPALVDPANLANPATVGTPANVATVAAGSTVSGRTPAYGASVDSAVMGCTVTIGSAPSGANPTVQFAFTLDGTTWLVDGGPSVVPLAASTSFGYRFDVPDAAQGGRVIVTNNSGGSITTWAEVSLRGVS